MTPRTKHILKVWTLLAGFIALFWGYNWFVYHMAWYHREWWELHTWMHDPLLATVMLMECRGAYWLFVLVMTTPRKPRP